MWARATDDVFGHACPFMCLPRVGLTPTVFIISPKVRKWQGPRVTAGGVTGRLGHRVLGTVAGYRDAGPLSAGADGRRAGGAPGDGGPQLVPAGVGLHHRLDRVAATGHGRDGGHCRAARGVHGRAHPAGRSSRPSASSPPRASVMRPFSTSMAAPTAWGPRAPIATWPDGWPWPPDARSSPSTTGWLPSIGSRRRWTTGSAAFDELATGIPPGRIALAGDSAGGGLVMAVLLALRRSGTTLPAAAVCLSPWVDLTQSGDSYRRLAEADPMVSKDNLDMMAAAYLGSADPTDELASPVLAAELSGLPPVMIEVGEHEVLVDDATRLAERLRGRRGRHHHHCLAGDDPRLPGLPWPPRPRGRRQHRPGRPVPAAASGPRGCAGLDLTPADGCRRPAASGPGSSWLRSRPAAGGRRS